MTTASAWRKHILRAGIAALMGCVLAAEIAHAITIELKDVAPDRIERQRRNAAGQIPLPNTPDVSKIDERLAAKGVERGDEVFIRIFKAESELELWLRKDDHFVLLDTYPMCHWSGTLGPKVLEGDKQNPEGFYKIRRRNLHLAGRWPRSLNLGFPNPFDRSQSRTGSYILLHGGCSSVGCFAMTDPVMQEIYGLTETAMREGQEIVNIHVFPFRMTDDNMQRYGSAEWNGFWQNLKEGYDAFEATHVPPRVGVCDKRYVIQSVSPDQIDAHPVAASSRRGRNTSDYACLAPVAEIEKPEQDADRADDVAQADREVARSQSFRRITQRAQNEPARPQRKSSPAASQQAEFKAADFFYRK